MIENIQTPSPITGLTDNDIRVIFENVVKTYPYPLAVSFQNQEKANDTYSLSSILLKDTLTTVLQYLALIGLWDYARSGIPSDFKVYNAVEQMVFRPGPGKWLGFLRTLMNYYRSSITPHDFIIPGMMNFLNNFADPKGLKIRLTEYRKHESRPILETLVILRNRWAHSKGWPDETVKLVSDNLFRTMAFIYHELAFLQETLLTVRSDRGHELDLIGTAVSENLKNLEASEVYLKMPARSESIMRLMMHWRADDKADILLLEEIIQDKQIIYSSSFHSERLSRNDLNYEQKVMEVIGVVEKVRAENPILSLYDLTFTKFAHRCNEHTASIIRDYQEFGKYNPTFYSEPNEIIQLMDAFIEDSETPALILSGEQGCGKSALLAHWASKIINSCNGYFEGIEPAIFMLECHSLPAMVGQLKTPKLLIDEALRVKLFLEKTSTPENYLSRLSQGRKESGKSAKFILIIDAINEYEWGEYERRQLLLELPSYIRDLEGVFGTGNIKMILSLRWSLFNAEGFGEKEFIRNANILPDTFFKARIDQLKISIEVPKLSAQRAETLYNLIQDSGIGMSPRISWAELDLSIQKLCYNPMMMQFFMHANDGKTRNLISIRNADHIKRRYVSELLVVHNKDDVKTRKAKSERLQLVLNILEAMRSQRTMHLPLNSSIAKVKGKKREQTHIDHVLSATADRARMSGEGLVASPPYQELIEQGMLREELVRLLKAESPEKRISFNHEMISCFLENERQNIEQKERSRFSWYMSFIVVMILMPFNFILFIKGQQILALSSMIFVLLAFSLLKISQYGFKKMACLKDYIIKAWFGQGEILSDFLILDCLKFTQPTLKKSQIIFVCSIMSLSLWVGFNYSRQDLLFSDATRCVATSFCIISVLSVLANHLEEIRFYLLRGARGLIRSNSIGRLCASSFLGWLLIIIILNVGGTCIFAGLFFVDRIQILLREMGFSGIDIEIYKELTSYPILNPFKLLAGTSILFIVLSLFSRVGYLAVYLKIRKLPLSQKWPENGERFHTRFRLIFWILFITLNISVISFLGFNYRSSFFDLGGNIFRLNEIIYDDGKVFSKTLNNDERDHITSLHQLIRVPDLKQIYLKNAAIKELTPLVELKNLVLLSFENCDIDDIGPLSKLQNLESIFLSGTKVTDIQPLVDCQKLKNLELSRTNIVNIKPLIKILSLEVLLLNETPVKNLEGFDRLPSLLKLHLKKTSLEDIKPLTSIKTLVNLNLSGTYIKDVSELASLPDLYVLDLSQSKFEDIHQLNNFKALKRLNLGKCNVKSFSPISFLSGLIELNLESTEIKDLSPLARLHNLQTLDLTRTLVEDLSPLKECNSLERLNISGTKVRDLTPLKYCENLRFLDISGCAINNFAGLDKIKNLHIRK